MENPAAVRFSKFLKLLTLTYRILTLGIEHHEFFQLKRANLHKECGLFATERRIMNKGLEAISLGIARQA